MSAFTYQGELITHREPCDWCWFEFDADKLKHVGPRKFCSAECQAAFEAEPPEPGNV